MLWKFSRSTAAYPVTQSSHYWSWPNFSKWDCEWGCIRRPNRTGINFTTKFTKKIWLLYLWAGKEHFIIRVSKHKTLSSRTSSDLFQNNVTSKIINQKNPPKGSSRLRVKNLRSLGLEETLQTIQFQPSCSRQGYLPLHQVVQSPIQPRL